MRTSQSTASEATTTAQRWSSLLAVGVCTFYIALLGWLAIWVAVPTAALRWQPVVVTSGSMRPLIQTGDVVLLEPVAPGEDLTPSTVITFRDPSRGDALVTHRIEFLNEDGSYTTRGDANGFPDENHVYPEDIVGKGALLVPLIGLPIAWLSTGEALLFMLWLIATLAALLVAVRNGDDNEAGPDGTESITSDGGTAPDSIDAGTGAPRTPTAVGAAPVAALWALIRRLPHLGGGWVTGPALRRAVGIGLLIALVGGVAVPSQAAFVDRTGNRGSAFSAGSWPTHGWTAPVAVDNAGSTNRDTVKMVDAPGVLKNDIGGASGSLTVPTVINHTADTDNDSVWNDAEGRTNRDWVMHGWPTGSQHVAATGSAWPGTGSTYRFDGSASSGAEMNAFPSAVTTGSATFELWFRPDALVGHQVLYEAGGSIGTVIVLDGTVLTFASRQGSASTPSWVSIDLNTTVSSPTTEFIQVVGVIDMAVDTLEMYVNGRSMGSTAYTFTDWAGSDPSGLGRDGGTTPPIGGSGRFDGDIAISRFYDSALTPREVLGNFAAVSGGGLTVVAVNGDPAAVGVPTLLPSGAVVVVQNNGAVEYDPNGAFDYLPPGGSTTDSFTYTISNPGGQTDVGLVTMTVNAPATVNDIVINEFMPSYTDTGSYRREWVELYNPAVVPIDVGGLYLDDTAGQAAPQMIPLGTTIPAGGRLARVLTGGILDDNRDQVRLLDTDAATVIDQRGYTGGTQPDHSFYRAPDGGGWCAGQTASPTPNAQNQSSCITDVAP